MCSHSDQIWIKMNSFMGDKLKVVSPDYVEPCFS